MTEPKKNNIYTYGVIIGTAIAIIGVIAYYIFVPQQAPTPTAQTQQPSQAASQEQSASAAQVAVTTSETENAGSNDSYQPLISDDLTKQPIPQDPALVQDEIAKLKDIEKQLNEQKQLLEQQHKDADQLIALKEQQIADLEQQLKQQP